MDKTDEAFRKESCFIILQNEPFLISKKKKKEGRKSLIKVLIIQPSDQ